MPVRNTQYRLLMGVKRLSIRLIFMSQAGDRVMFISPFVAEPILLLVRLANKFGTCRDVFLKLLNYRLFRN